MHIIDTERIGERMRKYGNKNFSSQARCCFKDEKSVSLQNSHRNKGRVWKQITCKERVVGSG